MQSILLLIAIILAGASQSSTAQERKQPDETFVVEQTYWVKPGNENQFLVLYRKTELTRLQREQQAGNVLWIRLSEPLFASSSEQWDLRASVAWKSSAAAIAFAKQTSAESNPRESRRGNIEDTLLRALVENYTEVPVLVQSQ